jgi:RNA polymerase sigma-70 factor (ECF subfamily)
VWFQSHLESEERARIVTAALRHLPDTHQEVIVLKVWGELTFAEIAATLGIPLNTAASRYRYGLDGLRKHLSVSAL